jgi:hypothetical protein
MVGTDEATACPTGLAVFDKAHRQLGLALSDCARVDLQELLKLRAATRCRTVE